MFIILLGVTTIGILLVYQFFRWAMNRIMTTLPEEHQLDPLLFEENQETRDEIDNNQN